MKILLVGSDKVFAIENFYFRYLREMGIEVVRYPANTFFSNYYQQSIVNRILFKLNVSKIYDRINKELMAMVSLERPQIVWIFKGMEIYPETLMTIKALGIKLVNYNPDNPFLFSGKGSGNKNITNSIGHYDLHFTYNLDVKRLLEEQYKARVAWLPFGFDVSEELYEECTKQTEVVGACFLGNPDKFRANFIESLAEEGIPFTVFGLHWEKFVSHPLITKAGPVYGDELVKVLRRFRVQLNLMRPHNPDSHNMRTFEVPGVGGIMVAPDTTEHRLFFADGKEAFLFKDKAQCAENINHLLQLSTTEANEIRLRARMRSVSSGYSYKARSVLALKELRALVN